MSLSKLVRRILSFHKYPRYVADVGLTVSLPVVLRCKGVIVAKGISWLGRPIISREDGSLLSIGAGCVICSKASQTALGVNHAVILRTLRSGAELRIGSGVRMSGTTICSAERITIGDCCVIGANVTIVDTDFHSLDPVARSSPQDAGYARSRPVTVGNDVFIGGGSYILKGVTIGDGAVIGAGSVVTRDVAAGTIAAGNPAKRIGEVAQQDARSMH